MRDKRWHVDVLMPDKLSVFRATEQEARRYYLDTHVGGSILTVKLFNANHQLVASKSQFEGATHEERTSPVNESIFPHPQPHLELPFEEHGVSFQLYSYVPEKFLNVFVEQDGETRRIGTLHTAELHKLRDYLNSLDLAPVPPEWSGEKVTTVRRLLELADEVGDGGGEDFLEFVREFRKWSLTQPQ